MKENETKEGRHESPKWRSIFFQKKEKEIETRSYALKYAKHCEKERQRIRKKGTCALKYAIYFAISVLSLAFLTAY